MLLGWAITRRSVWFRGLLFPFGQGLGPRAGHWLMAVGVLAAAVAGGALLYG